MNPKLLKQYCVANAAACVVNGFVNECNATQLAENCAHNFGHDEWLDDSDHIVWDIAMDAAEAEDKKNHS